MKTITIIIAVLFASLSSLSAQRGGGSNHNNNNNNYNNNNNSGQTQFSSMLTLNTGENNGGIRPNGNVNNNGHHGDNNHQGNQGNHHHNGNQGNNNNHGNGHYCAHGSNCSFGCSHNNYTHTPVCMSAFDGWLHNLSHQNNSAVQMNIALDYVHNNWLTTHQVYDILGLFNNESIKLIIAEDAYRNTCDPYNFYMVYSQFSNSACVSHLQHFVVGH